MKYIVTLITLSLMLLSLGMSNLCCTDPDAWEAHQTAHQPPDKVMNAIGLKPGMSIGEIGAGRGRYAVLLAGRVGDTGKVYANDIDKDKLEYLEHRCERDSINNIIIIQGEETDPLFPDSSLDIAFMINTYHHIEKKVEVIKNTIQALKHGGILAIVEHDPLKIPDMESHTTAKEVLIDQAEQAGYELVRMEAFLERDNIYILRVKE
jgi:ubiquinone/menaquinone biosynthesis C-methylase UbiE